MTDSLRQFLVHFDDTPAAVTRLNLARALAAEHHGTVTALYAVTPSAMAVPLAYESGPEALAALREIDADRIQNAKLAFDRANETAPGVRADWALTEAFPIARAFEQQALYADLVLMGQWDPSGVASASGVPHDLVETTASASGKPVLVVPSIARSLKPARQVMIAWKPSREAARAVAAAMPLLRQARNVHVLAFGDAQDEGVDGAALGLEGWLRLHGVHAHWHREAGAEPAAVGEALLSRSFDLDADLLVMGCYGHSRSREWVLGGASRTILASMTLPVLLAH